VMRLREGEQVSSLAPVVEASDEEADGPAGYGLEPASPNGDAAADGAQPELDA
jgi:hypothetical protein